MSPRNSLVQFIVKATFVASLILGTHTRFEGSLFAQEPANAAGFKTLEIKLKPESKEFTDRRKEKNKACAAKDNVKVDAVSKFYEDSLLPRLTSSSPEVINDARKEILDDIAQVESNPGLIRPYNDMVIKWMKELLARDANQRVFSPSTRVEAVVILGRLNASVPKVGTGTAVPDVFIHPVLISLINAREMDGVSCAALNTLFRHLRNAPIVENAKKAFTTKLIEFVETPKPVKRSLEAHKYLTGQVIECLTQVAKQDPGKEPSKQATEFLTKLFVKTFDTEDSEWLLETACLSFGMFTPVNLSAEDITALEMGLVRYARRSLWDWKKRIYKSSGAGGMGMGMGGMSGSGGDGYGSGMMGGYGGEGGMGPGGQAKKTASVFDTQPKEVKNARRIAHQRFERIHFALNGSFRKPTATSPALPVSGLMKIMQDETEKAKIKTLIEKIEVFQTDLNDEKVKDLTFLMTAVGKSSRGIRETCVELLGESIVATSVEDAFATPAPGPNPPGTPPGARGTPTGGSAVSAPSAGR